MPELLDFFEHEGICSFTSFFRLRMAYIKSIEIFVIKIFQLKYFNGSAISFLQTSASSEFSIGKGTQLPILVHSNLQIWRDEKRNDLNLENLSRQI